MKKIFLFTFVILTAIGCVSKSEKEGENGDKMDDRFLPESTGQPGELVVVMNKEKWSMELGDALKGALHATVPGLSRNEPSFTTRVIEPFQFNRIFQLSRNIVYVTTLDGSTPADKWLQNTLSDNSKERIKAEPDLFMFNSDNQYAQKQKVMHLFGNNEQELIKHISENEEIIRNYFNMAERKRLAVDIRASIDSKVISNRYVRDHGYYIKVPVGYESAVDEVDFTWSRYLPSVGPSKNIFVYYKDYKSQDEFKPENVIKLRNDIGKQYIYGDPENSESFMITETEYMQPVFREINFDDKYTIEMRGAWKTNNFSVGGTFISYTFVDQPSNRLYYVEGFIIHPNEQHRELIRQMESIISTFRTVNTTAKAGQY
ncbi:MAG: hypothetical protein ACI905_002442 [Roseivirga sp.]|jgi:hypothetical protein